jgi:alpha/beta superfamily hydrolase
MKVAKTMVRFPSKALSLEGVLDMPQGRGPFPAVIVCHPHPLYGGNMENNVVSELCVALAQASLVAFKFNFRGVGASEGEYGEGIGEQEDVAAAISFLTVVREVDSEKIGLAGYSAGAAFALPVGSTSAQVRALAAISPPLSIFDFESLERCLKPKLLISGGRDEFTPTIRFLQFCQSLPDPKECHNIADADHFWWGYESELASKVTAFFAEVLKR